MTSRPRERDTEALKVASDIADQVNTRPEERQAAVLVGARAYRRGRVEEARLAELDRLERDAYARQLIEAKRAVGASLRAGGFNPAEVRYIQVLNTYGLSKDEIAKLFGVEPSVVGSVLESLGRGDIRFGSKSPPKLRLLEA